LFEARWRRWYGVSRRNRWAIVGGQLVAPVRRRKPPFWVWNAGLNQLYLSAYHLAPDLAPHYVEALGRYRIDYILGYSSALYALAVEMLRMGPTGIRLRVAITNAEPLFPYQRDAIAEAFACPVRETYGMSEGVAAASECEFGTLHAWPEAGWVEAMEEGCPVSPEKAGDLVCTGLLNRDMPLIRYRVGDRGTAPSMNADCPCGRTLPVIGAIEGRTDDVLYTADGRRVGRLDPVFKSQLPVKEAQIVQEALNRVKVRYVADRGFSQKTERAITAQLQARMGAITVGFEALDEIPRGANGKFRAVVCSIPAGQAPFRK
jgi:phenylacetate-CoA ligase